METTLQQPLATAFIQKQSKTQTSFPSRFLKWCDAQEKNRFGWLALAVATHGCIATPLTLFAVVFSGNNIALWMAAIIAMGMSLVTNLAAMPTRFTIPAFIISLCIDIAVIITCFVTGFAGASQYL